MSKEVPQFYVCDALIDAPKWVRDKIVSEQIEPPQEHEVLYIYGTPKLSYRAYFTFTADVKWVAEELKRVYDENVDKETGFKKKEVKRW